LTLAIIVGVDYFNRGDKLFDFRPV